MSPPWLQAESASPRRSLSLRLPFARRVPPQAVGTTSSRRRRHRLTTRFMWPVRVVIALALEFSRDHRWHGHQVFQERHQARDPQRRGSPRSCAAAVLVDSRGSHRHATCNPKIACAVSWNLFITCRSHQRRRWACADRGRLAPGGHAARRRRADLGAAARRALVAGRRLRRCGRPRRRSQRPMLLGRWRRDLDRRRHDSEPHGVAAPPRRRRTRALRRAVGRRPVAAARPREPSSPGLGPGFDLSLGFGLSLGSGLGLGLAAPASPPRLHRPPDPDRGVAERVGA